MKLISEEISLFHLITFGLSLRLTGDRLSKMQTVNWIIVYVTQKH